MKLQSIVTLLVAAAFVGCKQPEEKPIPTYPNPTEATQYELFDNGVLLASETAYRNGETNGTGKFLLCKFDQCGHEEPNYVAEVYYLFGEDYFSPLVTTRIYMWLEAEGLTLHSNRVAGEDKEFAGLDEYGYFHANLNEYIYDKFTQKNEICFWLQMSGETLGEGAAHELKLKFYDETTRTYYESEKYKLQLTEGGEFTIAVVK